MLDRHQITFVDLGCGAGAASAAILSVIEQYQDYLANLSQRIDPIKVNFIGIDTLQPELDSYKKFIEEYASNLKRQKIIVNIKTICRPFPEVTDELLAQLNLYKGHILIVGMSNLINWIWNEADPYLKQRKHESLQKLESLEIESLKKIAVESNFDISYVVGIATKNKTRWWLAACRRKSNVLNTN